jgi:UDP-galactopyranose mutase
MKITVVGAGLTGATIARLAAEAGHRVEVFEERPHVAGNAYDECVGGAWIHRYGPHLFHTNNFEVVKFLSRFTDWVEYQHRVVAAVGPPKEGGDYQTVPFPPNDKTRAWIRGMTGETSLDKLIIERFYRPYTEKMWGRKLEEVSPKILERVPSREGREDRYFPHHEWQFLPSDGYAAMVGRMLDHKNVSLELDTAFSASPVPPANKVFYCGGIDRFFSTIRTDYVLTSEGGYAPSGEKPRLAYRTIKFITTWKHSLQPWAVMNYTDQDVPFTRVTNWRRLSNSYWSDGLVDVGGGDKPRCPYTYEVPGQSERYEDDFYPVRDADSLTAYDAYLTRARQLFPDVHFVGRCGSYAYIDMDQAVNQAMQTVKKVLG